MTWSGALCHHIGLSLADISSIVPLQMNVNELLQSCVVLLFEAMPGLCCFLRVKHVRILGRVALAAKLGFVHW